MAVEPRKPRKFSTAKIKVHTVIWCPLTKLTATIRHASYMVSEVGWLAYVCSPLPHSISGLLTNGLTGNGDLKLRHASGLTAEDDSRQISTLLYCMGDNAEDTLASTNISRADRSRYAAVIAKFDAFFQVRNNVIFERARFNQRNQEEGEFAEQFITSLYSLADNCAYGNLKDDLIRDRIVVRIRATKRCQNACNWIRSWPWRKPRKSSNSVKLCRSSSKSSRMAPA